MNIKKYKCIKSYPKGPKIGAVVEKAGWGETWDWINEDLRRAKEFFEDITNQWLIEEAERRYPKGTRYKNKWQDDKWHYAVSKGKFNFWKSVFLNDKFISDGSWVYSFNRDEWAEILEPILVSEDSVKMYEGDRYWFVPTKVEGVVWTEKDLYTVHTPSTKIDDIEFIKSVKVFSSKEAAEKWCDENKPNHKEYEILSFRSSISSYVVEMKNGINKYGIKEQEYLDKSKEWGIYSIKRLSDGKVFTIGDRLTHEGIITKFLLSNNDKITVFSIAGSGNHSQFIQSCEKYKEPKFSYTTEDGVVINDPEVNIYGVSTKNWATTLPRKARNFAKGANNNYKFFSSGEKRSEYIAEYKPMYSKHDIIECLKDDHIEAHGYSIMVLDDNLF